MSRLTNSIRESMARKLVAYRYTDEMKELVQLNRTLAKRVYDHCYPKKITDAMDLIEKEFPDTFSTCNSIYVNAGGYKVTLGGRLASKWVTVPQEAPTSYVVAGSYNKHDISKDEKLTEEVKALAIRLDGLQNLCATAYSEALSVLNTMTTGKKLAEAWPEAMDVIGDLIPEGDRTLPVVQVSAINAKFKLPPKKDK